MPPPSLPSQQSHPPAQAGDTSHMLPEGHRSSVGPWVGAIIIVFVLGFGAFYFYGEYLNNQNAQEQLPFIQGDISA